MNSIMDMGHVRMTLYVHIQLQMSELQKRSVFWEVDIMWLTQTSIYQKEHRKEELRCAVSDILKEEKYTEARHKNKHNF